MVNDVLEQLREDTNSFREWVCNNWQEFEYGLIKSCTEFHNRVNSKFSKQGIASDYDFATDENHYNVKGFDYRNYLPNRISNHHTDALDTSSQDNLNIVFTSHPAIQKIRTEDLKRRSERDAKATAIEFLLQELPKITHDTQTITEKSHEKIYLISKLFIKLIHEKKLYPLWDDTIFQKLGIGESKSFLEFPLGQYFKNFDDAVIYVKRLFSKTIIKNFEFSQIRTDIIFELLINSLQYYLTPQYFNYDTALNLAENIKNKFDYSSDKLLDDKTYHMKKHCPERSMKDLLFLGLMSQTDIFCGKYSKDLGVCEKFSSNFFSYIGNPLIPKFVKQDFYYFLRCYGCNTNFLEIPEDKIELVRNKYNTVCTNLKIFFRRRLLIAFIDSVLDIYQKQISYNVVSKSVDPEDILIIKTKLMDQLCNIYPDGVEFYLQPSCRKIMADKFGLDYLEKAYLSHINACVLKTKDSYIAVKICINRSYQLITNQSTGFEFDIINDDVYDNVLTQAGIKEYYG